MSIQTRILIPMFLIVALGAATTVMMALVGVSDRTTVANVAERALQAAEISRKASEDFEAAGLVAAEVGAMPICAAPPLTRRLLATAADAADADLKRLQDAALSDAMRALAKQADESFLVWREDAEGLLGLKPVQAVATAEALRRQGDATKARIGDAIARAGADARLAMSQAADSAKAKSETLLSVAGALALAAIAGAVFVARGVARPLVRLSERAVRLAEGDVSVEFEGVDRSDEIGAIASAVARFRDNVAAGLAAEAEAARNRERSEKLQENAAEAQRQSETQQREMVETLADALGRISGGDLTVRIDRRFSGRFEQIQRDFNAAVAQLERTIGDVNGAASTIRARTEELAGASERISERTAQQAAGLEASASALEEINASMQKAAEGAKFASEVVRTADADAKASSLIVNDAQTAMSAISQSANRISQIITVIDEIAFQTNLLALNAGVEAARAGEAGKGFAVVASEVRALAMRSAEAAREIKQLISTSTTQVGEGVKLVSDTGQSLLRIVDQVARINAIVTDIANGAREQSMGLSSIHKAITDIDRTTQENASMVGKSTVATGSLSKECGQLSDLVERFRIGGHGETREVRRQRAA